MSLIVSFHDSAAAEFHEATAFYAMESADLAEGFINEVEYAVARIRELPEGSPLLRGRVRKRRLRKFPYSVLYSIGDEEIRVLAIAHNRRRPSYWHARR